jgi:uncharacterized protein
MHSSVICGIKKLIEKRVLDIDHLHVDWFGGEPLIAQDVVFELSEFAANKCREAKIKFTGGMTTNGSKLTKKLLAV